MAPVAIEVNGLKKAFGNLTAVDGIDLEIHQGEIYGFVGPNGSGKTTTIRMLCGLLTPDAGQGTCLGYDLIKHSKAIKAKLGYMTQQFSLYNDLSIFENLQFNVQLYPIKKSRQRIHEMMEWFALTHRRDQLAGTLSGGWKQRLALAVALLHRPSLLLLDEPTSGVDLQARREFWANIENIASEGVTALVSTHYMDEVIRCHRLAYIADGRVLAQGRASTMINEAALEAWMLLGDNWRDVLNQLNHQYSQWQMAPQKDGIRLIVSPHEGLPDFSDYGLRWEKTELTFEDVFVGLMQRDVQP